MLDAAERVFVEVGYDTATTTLIAVEAKTSVGSIYHFFTDKLAIANVLSARYLTRLWLILDGQHGEDQFATALDGIVGTLVRFAEGHPGLEPLLRRPQAHHDDLRLAIHTVLAEHLDRLLNASYPAADPARRLTVATICAILLLSRLESLTTQPPSRRTVAIAETKLALSAYAVTALPQAQTGPEIAGHGQPAVRASRPGSSCRTPPARRPPRP